MLLCCAVLVITAHRIQPIVRRHTQQCCTVHTPGDLFTSALGQNVETKLLSTEGIEVQVLVYSIDLESVILQKNMYTHSVRYCCQCSFFCANGSVEVLNAI